MATLRDAKTAKLKYTLIDVTGSKSSIMFDVPWGTLAAAALLAGAAIQALIEAVTDCDVVGMSLTYKRKATTRPVPTGDNRVERKGAIQFLTAAGKVVTYQIPGIKSSMLRKSGGIDEDKPAMLALTTAMVEVGSIWCDSNGEDLTDYWAGYERFNSSTKAQLPSDRTPDEDLI